MGEAMLNNIIQSRNREKRPEEDIILNTLEVFNVDAETEDDDY